MNNFALLAAVFCVAAATGTHGFLVPQRAFTKKDVVCSGDAHDDVMDCMRDLAFLAHPWSAMTLIRVDTQEALDNVCIEMQQASQCVDDVHAECGQGEMMTELMSTTIGNVVDYMCDPANTYNKQVILSEAECWENEQLGEDMRDCVRNNQVADHCSFFKEIRSCIAGQVAIECGAVAANFIDGLVYRSIQPFANTMHGCEIGVRISRSIWSMLPRSRK